MRRRRVAAAQCVSSSHISSRPLRACARASTRAAGSSVWSMSPNTTRSRKRTTDLDQPRRGSDAHSSGISARPARSRFADEAIGGCRGCGANTTTLRAAYAQTGQILDFSGLEKSRSTDSCWASRRHTGTGRRHTRTGRRPRGGARTTRKPSVFMRAAVLRGRRTRSTGKGRDSTCSLVPTRMCVLSRARGIPRQGGSGIFWMTSSASVCDFCAASSRRAIMPRSRPGACSRYAPSAPLLLVRQAALGQVAAVASRSRSAGIAAGAVASARALSSQWCSRWRPPRSCACSCGAHHA